MGFPSGPRSKLQPDRKAAFLTGSSAVSEQYFETVYKWVYTHKLHNDIEAHLGLQRTARDVIKMAPLSVDIETLKKDAAVANEKKDCADEESYEGDSNDEEATQVEISPKHPLAPSKNDASPPDKGVFIGFQYDGTEIRSKGMPIATVKQLLEVAQECKHAVDR